ncbi:MAG: hypothetical protein MUF23_10360 [Pirellula sp.]|nr:hypothetical protein [Pirellula sp.]
MDQSSHARREIEMQAKKFGPVGFLIAGAMFMFAAVIPLLSGKSPNVAFFCLGIAFIVIALGIAKTSK